MFYKRISDLHPLGKKNGSWNNVEPIPIPDPGKYYNTVSSTITTVYDNKTDVKYSFTTLTNRPSANQPEPIFTEFNTAFNNSKNWYGPSSINMSHPHAETKLVDDGSDPNNIKSEYYGKSLWFEVAISKDKNNAPTSAPSNTIKYQSKRVNAFTLFTNIDEISANEISAPVINVTKLICNEISTDTISADYIKTNTIIADYGDISSLHATSITADGISASIGYIKEISGNHIYYTNARFTNITVPGVAHLTAEAAYWADLAEMYSADKNYIYGTLVKFGGEKEITIADDKANAVISEKPAITLNSGNVDENALPIVLTGRSKVRTIHPVQKFDKIYLSETPGVGSISSYKISSATMPIGIALENKPYDEEGLVECILQLNFD